MRGLRRDNSENPVTWGYGTTERGLQKGDQIHYKGKPWKIVDYKIMVIDGHFTIEIYIEDFTSRDRTDVITSEDIVTAVEWHSPDPMPNLFKIEDAEAKEVKEERLPEMLREAQDLYDAMYRFYSGSFDLCRQKYDGIVEKIEEITGMVVEVDDSVVTLVDPDEEEEI